MAYCVEEDLGHVLSAKTGRPEKAVLYNRAGRRRERVFHRRTPSGSTLVPA